MKPRSVDDSKVTLMKDFYAQAEFDCRMWQTGDERGPGFNYYYHDEMDHLVRLPVKYLTTGHTDSRAPGGYVDNYVVKGYRVIADGELLDIVRRQQAEKYARLQVAPPWAAAAPEKRSARNAQS